MLRGIRTRSRKVRELRARTVTRPFDATMRPAQAWGTEPGYRRMRTRSVGRTVRLDVLVTRTDVLNARPVWTAFGGALTERTLAGAAAAYAVSGIACAAAGASSARPAGNKP